MNIFALVRQTVTEAINSLKRDGVLPESLDAERITLEPPRDSRHGDMACNAAMILAGPAHMAPRELATLMIKKLEQAPIIKSAVVAGPGFINLTLSASLWPDVISAILSKGFNYGQPETPADKKVMVEYVSANPTGPLHGGHVRGAVFGDALANLLDYAGYDVCREFYVNDSGGQIVKLVGSVFLRYREALGETIKDIPAGFYPGDYLKPIGEALAERFGSALLDKNDAERFEIIRPLTVNWLLDSIKADLADLGIYHDIFTSEHDLIHAEQDRVAETLTRLDELGHLYYGTLEPPKGQKDAAWEAREQWLFRSTDFGDSEDRALKKSDDSYTYFANDITYHADKINRGYCHLVNVWGADHAGYVARMKAAVKALSSDQAHLDIKICQIVHLYRDGEIIKMSKRAGEFLTLRDMIDDVGKDVLRFFMLTRSNDSQLDFDFSKVKAQSKENPVFYVNYAHARTFSVLRQASEQGVEPDKSDLIAHKEDFALLDDPDELALIKRLATFPRLVSQAVDHHEPHRLAFYAEDIAGLYHALWNKGKDDERLRFIQANNLPLTRARLGLNLAVREILATCMTLLGVEPVQVLK